MNEQYEHGMELRAKHKALFDHALLVMRNYATAGTEARADMTNQLENILSDMATIQGEYGKTELDYQLPHEPIKGKPEEIITEIQDITKTTDEDNRALGRVNRVVENLEDITYHYNNPESTYDPQS